MSFHVRICREADRRPSSVLKKNLLICNCIYHLKYLMSREMTLSKFLLYNLTRATKFCRISLSFIGIVSFFVINTSLTKQASQTYKGVQNEFSTLNMRKSKSLLFTMDCLLTGRFDLFTEDCDCTWAYTKSNQCHLVLNKKKNFKCQKICCIGWQATIDLAPTYQPLIPLTRLPRVLVGIASSEKTFNPRILAILQSWARRDSVPKNTNVFFFFGEDVKESILLFFQKNEISIDLVVFLPGIVDDQYPPVRKNMAMLDWLQTFFLEEEKWDWIFKVDDDTLVNWPKIVDHLAQFSPQQQSLYIGSRGFGRPHERNRLGLQKPFCMGGPGYLLSDSLIRELPERAFSVCAEVNSRSGDYRWHSDVIAGLCVYNHTRLGCWDRNADIIQMYDDKKRLFWHDSSQTDSFPPYQNALNLYTLHPFKNPGTMVKLFTQMNSLINTTQ